MAEKALTAVTQEAHMQGISTRRVDDLVKIMGVPETRSFRSSTNFETAEGSPNVSVHLSHDRCTRRHFRYSMRLGWWGDLPNLSH